MKILIVAHSGSRGGAELCLDTMLRHLDRERFRAAVVFGWEGPMVEAAREMGYAVEVMPLAWWMGYEPSRWHYQNALAASWPRIGRLVRRIKREAIDLVYTNTAVIFEGALAARLAGVPHVWHVHEVLTPHHMKPSMLPLGWIKRLIGRLSDRVIFTSDSARTICEGEIGREKCVTVYNAARFDPSLLETPAGPHPGDLPEGEGTERCVVAWIGRFSERKNPRMLLQAAAQMKELKRAEFVLVGEGPLENPLREEIERLGLGERCRLVPFQEDVRPLLEACDVLALTSLEESFGLVLVEAGALGKPVVSTRTQGPAEIVVDGQTGFLVPPEEPAALAARLDRLVADPGLRQAMGRAGAARVAERFSAKKNTRKIEAVIEEVCRSRW